MKTTIHLISCKPLFKIVRIFAINLSVVAYFLVPTTSFSQCTSYTVNWDYLDFLHSASSSWYNGFVTNTMKQSQNFAIGPRNVLNISTSMAAAGTGSFYGDITTHGGDVPGYTGDDISFTPTIGQTITFTFLNEVSNASFTLYDLDRNSIYNVTAADASNAAQIVNATTYNTSGTTIQTISGSPGKTLTAGTTTASNLTPPDNRGTVTINVTGTIKTITITATAIGSDPQFWLSDIIACSADPSFPTDYYKPYTQPYTGQPAYFLANPDMNLNVYMVDPVNRTADLLFTDPGIGGNALNSIAYDPVNKYVYYVMNGSGAGAGNRALKRYDVTTNSISTIISDINAFGIPTFTQGVEAASASFYNGCLYLGIEGTEPSNFMTSTESIIWRIDFNGTTPIRASQVFGVLNDDGNGQPSHDWGDFVTKDGTIITHASTRITPSYQSQWIHFNMTTSTATNTYNLYADTSGQLGQIYDGTVYRVDNQIALYNDNGTTAAANSISVTSCSPSWNNRSANDASDPFRPALDFGDAPSTYDPVALSPAANQKACNNSTLRIGSVWDREWNLGSSSDASGDGTDEDGITTVTNMVSDGSPYNHVQEVTVLNNTGATAYLAGWLDYNADGVFDASEGVVVAVPSSASPQTISLGWIGITVASGTPNSFLRVRLYSGALTANDATGWLSDGETEDYPVVSAATPLTIQLLNFNASLTADKNVWLSWKASVATDDLGFEVQRSSDKQNWEKIKWVNVSSATHIADYSLLDNEPLEGTSYYRLKMVEKSGSSKYSSTRTIQIDQLRNSLKVYPNPAKNDMNVSFNSNDSHQATLVVRSLAGEMMMKRPLNINQGDNLIKVSLSGFSNGLYIIELITPEKRYINKLSVTH